MNIIKELELILDKTLSKNIALYKRKNATLSFISYREGVVDKNTESFYLTAVKNDILESFLNRNISINDILKNAPVIFYALGSINNRECTHLSKIKYIDIDISNDMTSLKDLNTCDKIKELAQSKIDIEFSKKDIIENTIENVSYDISQKHVTDIDDDTLLSDEKIYDDIEEVEEEVDENYDENINDDINHENDEDDIS